MTTDAPEIEHGNPYSVTCRWCGNRKTPTGKWRVCAQCDYAIQPGTRRIVGPGL